MRAINADALMEAINTWPKFGVDERCRIVPWREGYEPYIHLRDAVIAITGMPTIEPERRKGKWIDNETSYADGVRQTCTCSICGQRSVRPLGRFCRWCGADVGGEENETD